MSTWAQTIANRCDNDVKALNKVIPNPANLSGQAQRFLPLVEMTKSATYRNQWCKLAALVNELRVSGLLKR